MIHQNIQYLLGLTPSKLKDYCLGIKENSSSKEHLAIFLIAIRYGRCFYNNLEIIVERDPCNLEIGRS
jgi:hypothetical protein